MFLYPLSRGTLPRHPVNENSINIITNSNSHKPKPETPDIGPAFRPRMQMNPSVQATDYVAANVNEPSGVCSSLCSGPVACTRPYAAVSACVHPAAALQHDILRFAALLYLFSAINQSLRSRRFNCSDGALPCWNMRNKFYPSSASRCDVVRYLKQHRAYTRHDLSVLMGVSWHKRAIGTTLMWNVIFSSFKSITPRTYTCRIFKIFRYPLA